MTASDRAHLIRTELTLGRWWRAAPLLLEAKTSGDWLLAGTWTRYVEQLGVSTRHADRLVTAAPHANPTATLKSAYEMGRALGGSLRQLH